MICFVILHYIAFEETINCVNSILSNIIGEKKIIIVDNSSPNNSYNMLKDQYKNIQNVYIIQTKSNIGFARGNNYGYRYAIKHFNPSFIIVMNNDMTITQSDFLYQIQKCYEKYHFYIMGPDIYSTKGHYHQNPQTKTLPTYQQLKKDYIKLWIKDKLPFFIWAKWKINNIKKQSKSNVIKKTYVDHVVVNSMLHGSCYIFSSAFMQKHKNKCFYDKTFMYLEAEILYYLSIRNGEKMVYCPSLKVEHHEDVATDLKYKEQYKKSIFSIKCLLQSTGAFIDLIEKNEGKK